MNTKKRAIIIIAIIVGAIVLSALINLCISLIQEARYPLEYSEQVKKYAKEFNVPEYVIYAVINADSNFDPAKQYEGGSKGLMRIRKSAFLKISSPEHLSDDATFEDLSKPDVSIRFGAYYLRYLFDRYRSWDTAIVAYFAGEEQTDEWLSNQKYSPDRKELKKIPQKEAKKYLKKVNGAIDYYKDTYYRNGAFTK